MSCVIDLPSIFDKDIEVEVLKLSKPLSTKKKGDFIFRADGEYFRVDTPYWWLQKEKHLFGSNGGKYIVIKREFYNNGKNARLYYIGESEF